MKICVLGAGALGCAIGGALAEGGSEVWLINRSAAHVDAINASGLVLVTPEGERRVQVKAARTCAGVGPADLVIVLVKSFHTREAMEGAADILGDQTLVLSLQNGLGHEEVLAEYVGRDRVLAGKTYVGGVLLAPGRIISGTVGKHTYIGELDGAPTARVRAVAAEFERAGLATTVSDDIMATMWDKLLINVSTGAVSGITGLAYGPLYDVPGVKAVALAAVEEAMACARASGVKLGIATAEEAWVRASEKLPPDFKASMLQSLEKGSVTEIDFVNGSVVEAGARLGIPTPVNQTLIGLMKGVERAMLDRQAATRTAGSPDDKTDQTKRTPA